MFRNFKSLLIATAVGAHSLTGCSENPDKDGHAGNLDSSVASSPRFIRNKIKWETASESETFGYFLVRSESESGPFEKVNRVPIPATGTTDDVQVYEIVDETAVPGTKYFYKIESLHYNNRIRNFSPVFPYQTPAS